MKPTHLLMALAVVLIWGVNFVVIHWGLGELPPFLLAALRFTLAVLPAILWIRKPAVPWRYLFAYGLLNSFGQFAFLFWAMRVGMPAGLASVVHQSQVFFTLVLSMVFLHQRSHVHQWLGLMLAVVGLTLIAQAHGAGVNGMTSFGLVLNLLAALSWAAGNIVVAMMRRAGHTPDALGLVVWSSLVPIVPFLLLSWVFERGLYPDWHAVGWHSVVSILYLAWAATLLGYGLWSRLLGIYEPNRVAPFSLLVPVIGLLTARVVLGESLNLWQWLGSAGLILGLVVNLWGGRWRGAGA